MNLYPAPDDPSNMYCNVLTSSTGLIKMAIHPVIYGFRVRGWFTNEHQCRIDWCGGANQPAVERLYSLLRNILLQRLEDNQAFNQLPEISKVKPYYQDVDFVIDVLKHVKDPIEIITLPDLQQSKHTLFNAYAEPLC